MANRIFFFSLLLLLATLTPLQAFQRIKTEPVMPQKDPYQAEWKVIDSLENEGLPRSALEKVEALYARAKKDKENAQVVKTIIYRNKYQSQIEEYGPSKTILRMEEEAKAAEFPVQPILYSLLGELYQNFADQNYWRFADRTNVTGSQPDDLNTWSLDQILGAASRYYLLSVEDVRTFDIPISEFAAITIEGQGNTDELRPTLYDFLAHRAIDHFSNERSYLSQPAYRFQMDREDAFGPADEFIQLQFETKDTASYKLKTLQLFQSLLARRLAEDKPAALLDADLDRLNFVRNNTVLSNKDSLYLSALQLLERRYNGQPLITEVWFQMAQLFANQGEGFDPKFPEKNKWKLKDALELCDKAIEQAPESYGAAQCKALRSRLLLRKLSMTVEEVNIPGQPALALMSYRNVDLAHLRVVRLTEEEYSGFRNRQAEEIFAILAQKKALRDWKVSLPDDGDLQEHSAELAIDPLPIGFYAVMLSESEQFTYSQQTGGYLYTVFSNLSYFSRRGKDNASEFLLLQRETGAPQEGVLAEFFTSQYNRRAQKAERVKIGQAYSNKEGFIYPDVKENTYFQVRFSKGEDVLFFEDGFSNYTRSTRRPKDLITHFFLDRAIYRPGQTVFFKAIVLDNNENGVPSILSGHPFEVTFFDANGQEVSKLELRTNEFGTANGSFTAPKGGLLGQMRLSSNAGNSSHFFSVEEYKRPKFEVVMDPLAGSPALNDTVVVSGKAMAFAGSAIDGAEVTYRVVREVRFPWWPWWRFSRPAFPTGESQEIASGSLKTDAEGKFELSFTAIPDRSVDRKDNPEFVFTVYIDVIDITGETHSTEKSVHLAYLGLKADVSIPGSIGRDGGLAPVRIITQNLDGQPQPAKGAVTVYRLEAPQRIYVGRYWEKPDRYLMKQADFERTFQHYAFSNQDESASWAQAEQVLNQPFQTPENDTLFVNPSGWPVGHYALALQTQDDKGNAIEVKKFFTVYDVKQQLLPEGTLAWKQQQQDGPYQPGDEAVIMLGTSAGQLNVLYELERRMETVESSWRKVQAWDDVRYKVTEADKGNVFAHLSFVKFNRAFTWTESINVPWSDKELKIEYSTFRDKLSPGQEEAWQLKVSGPDKEKVSAEMVAALYDASLDQFRPNDWSFNPYPYNAAVRSWQPAHFGSTSLFGYYYYPYPEGAPQRSYRYLNWFNFYFYNLQYSEGNLTMRAAARMEDAAMAPMAFAEEPDMAMAKSAVPPPPPPPAPGQDTSTEQGAAAEPAPSVRTNLKETVFFFPELRTDEDGNVLIRFTMNEALTRWKFLAMAHTRELQYAVSENQTVTQKELMVLPNPPRFFREGDEIEFTAKVSNLTDKSMKGSAQLLLFDALSMQPIDGLLGNDNSSVAFEAAPGQSARLAWNLKIPVGKVMAVTHRIIAKAGNFSDGEESAVPVLTNRTLVTETMPMPLKGGETKTFTFAAMEKAQRSSTLQNQSFTLEMTSNPAWYAVKALPYLMEFPYECSEQVFSRYYANTLAASIANSSPAIKRVFERWRDLEPEALVSELEKNQELKAVLLEETPWVRQAQSETEQRQRIGLLFDLNRMSYEQENAIAQLSEMQSASGGFPWFPGGRENWYITQYILEGMGHLRALGVKDIQPGSKAGAIATQAAGFVDREMAEYYEDMVRRWANHKDDAEKDHLTGIAIHYLYTRSLFPELPVEGKAKEAWDYFLGQGKKYWLQKGLYEQGMLAVVMQRTDNAETAKRIVSSLRERALYNEELGMYWKYNTGYFWYEAPIETHAMMIEVFSEVAKDENAVEQLKIWLLKNKQTNNWKTTKATANAVYALLRYGDNWLEGTQLAQVSFPALGKDDYQPQLKAATAAAEAGTGYFKANWTGEQVRKGFEKVRVSNPNKNIAWGAAYWQYFEDLDKVDIFRETPLTMVRQLFKEVIGDKGPELTPISADNPLRPGDKLTVRIELRVDRDMEYVHMKDMRASGLEPINVFSQYKWQGGLGYYESTRDAATHFFFHYLPKGTYVFEYPLRVVHKGDFSNGISSIQCMYAPEYTSHSEGVRIRVQ